VSSFKNRSQDNQKLAYERALGKWPVEPAIIPANLAFVSVQTNSALAAHLPGVFEQNFAPSLFD